MSPSPRIGLSLGPGEDFRVAATPLFEAGLVDAVEWMVDARWAFGPAAVPAWVDAVLDVYADAGCLYGHGVTFSALSGAWEPRQETWLENLGRELRRRRYVHITEHFGFMSARGFLPSAPLPVPRTGGSLRVGHHALDRLSDVVGSPVGLENLAVTLGPKDLEDQSDFLRDLVQPTGGFLILDLHNLYCQAVNFDTPLRGLIDSFPRSLVREIHVAGGRAWRSKDDPARVLQTDSHDGAVPLEVIDSLRYAVEACPNLEVVMLERFFGTLGTERDVDDFRDDYQRVRKAALGEQERAS